MDPTLLPELLPAFTLSEIDDFLHILCDEGVVVPLMSLRDPFAQGFIEKDNESLRQHLEVSDEETILAVINLYLTSLYRNEYESKTLAELQCISESIHLHYTQEQIEFIEYRTRAQKDCMLWFRFRAGRITGSTFKSVCRTSIITPAISTVEKICFPESKIFKSKQTEYGKRNESNAIGAYERTMHEEHSNFKIIPSGLVINNDYPQCGVSPDGLTYCDCCGSGVLEVKCPWLMRFGSFDAYLKKKDCPLTVVEEDRNSTYNLVEGHEYYYQVQMEMVLCDVEFCDFVVYNPKTTLILRIRRNYEFWNIEYEKTKKFHQKVILPELLGTFYSRNKREAEKTRRRKR